MENPNYKNENIDRKYLKIMRKNQLFKGKTQILELEKDFLDLKDIELKDREIRIDRDIEELFFKAIYVSIDAMDRFEKKK